MNWFDDYIVTAGSVADVTPPTITLVSPAAPGGFPVDYATAKDTEIVLDITDLAPGNRYICLVARLGGGTAPPASIAEEVVYRRGAFRGAYLALSFSEAIANGIRLHCRRVGGWPGSGTVGDVTFELDALDQAGNLAA